MADIYCSTSGSNTSPYDTWAKAATTFATAVGQATGNGDIIRVAHDHSESLASADKVYTFANNVRVLCVNSGTGALATTAVIGAQATNFGIQMAGAYKVYIYGIQFKIPGEGSDSIGLNGTDGGHFEYESCRFEFGTFGASSVLALTVAGADPAAAGSYYTRLRSCGIKFGATGQKILYTQCNAVFEDVTIEDAGSAPTVLFSCDSDSGYGRLSVVNCEACDFSKVTGTLVGDVAARGAQVVTFSNCKLGSVVATNIMAAPTTVTNKGSTSVWCFNCHTGDSHYFMFHGDAFGYTEATVAYTCDDGAAYDGTNKVAWKITTRATNCSFYTPYVSPWIDKYQAAATITPSIEGLRVDSTTIIQDDEVWAEFSAQTNANTTQSSIDNTDRMTPLGSAADQTSAKAYSDWTGVPTDTDAGDSTFKLTTDGAITVDEIGYLRARVCVGEPNLVVYIDPTIRVA